ncbi:MAG: hypothetical protein H7Y88_05340 [Phycisphaerales bacterium]|nr:hypothetical protein [Phycisphaerales bacterium]
MPSPSFQSNLSDALDETLAMLRAQVKDEKLSPAERRLAGNSIIRLVAVACRFRDQSDIHPARRPTSAVLNSVGRAGDPPVVAPASTSASSPFPSSSPTKPSPGFDARGFFIYPPLSNGTASGSERPATSDAPVPMPEGVARGNLQGSTGIADQVAPPAPPSPLDPSSSPIAGGTLGGFPLAAPPPPSTTEGTDPAPATEAVPFTPVDAASPFTPAQIAALFPPDVYDPTVTPEQDREMELAEYHMLAEAISTHRGPRDEKMPMVERFKQIALRYSLDPTIFIPQRPPYREAG